MQIFKANPKNIEVIAVQFLNEGHYISERANARFNRGDWLLTNSIGEQWIVTDEYFLNNYDFAHDQNNTNPTNYTPSRL